jgi:hypothetical protein
MLKIEVNLHNVGLAWFLFSKKVAISIFADHGLTGHRIGEKQSALRVPTL